MGKSKAERALEKLRALPEFPSSLLAARKLDQPMVEAFRQLPMSPKLRESIADLAQALPGETDWLRVKRALLLLISPAERQLFSRRDEDTKKHPPFNQLETAVRIEWTRLTGNVLMMPADKMMDDVDPDRYL